MLPCPPGNITATTAARLDERAASRPGEDGTMQRASRQQLAPRQEPLRPAVIPRASHRPSRREVERKQRMRTGQNAASVLECPAAGTRFALSPA
jgi:hypothetical protein